MGVERRDLVDLGLRELHLRGERGEMRRRQMAVAVLQQMQVLDQQIAPARPVAEQRPHLFERARIDLPALRGSRGPAALPAGQFGRGVVHGHVYAAVCTIGIATAGCLPFRMQNFV